MGHRLPARRLRPGRAGNSRWCSRRRPLAYGRGPSRWVTGIIPLLGTGAGPPLPAPTVTLDLKQAASAQQGTMIVHFDAPAQTSGSGTATLDFQGPADSAIGFAAGGRSVTFPIAPGDVQAVLPFQTGTSAGVLTFTARVGGASDQQSVTITGGPPAITAVQAGARRARWRSTLQALTTHAPWERCRLRFTMPPASRSRRGRLRTNAASDFASYFAGSDLGGVFVLRAVFPVTGDARVIAACEATLTNTSGSSSTQRTFF